MGEFVSEIRALKASDLSAAVAKLLKSAPSMAVSGARRCCWCLPASACDGCCVPARAELRASLPPPSAPPTRAQVLGDIAHVPRYDQVLKRFS